jgi:hypothetical protein
MCLVSVFSESATALAWHLKSPYTPSCSLKYHCMDNLYCRIVVGHHAQNSFFASADHMEQSWISSESSEGLNNIAKKPVKQVMYILLYLIEPRCSQDSETDS